MCLYLCSTVHCIGTQARVLLMLVHSAVQRVQVAIKSVSFAQTTCSYFPLKTDQRRELLAHPDCDSVSLPPVSHSE